MCMFRGLVDGPDMNSAIQTVLEGGLIVSMIPGSLSSIYYSSRWSKPTNKSHSRLHATYIGTNVRVEWPTASIRGLHRTKECLFACPSK